MLTDTGGSEIPQTAHCWPRPHSISCGGKMFVASSGKLSITLLAAKDKHKPLPCTAHLLLALSQHLSPPAQHPGGLGVPCPGDSTPLSRKGAPLLLFPSEASLLPRPLPRRPCHSGRAQQVTSSLHTPVLLPGKSHGRRSLVGCSPWGFEESDTTERLHFHFSLSCIGEGNGNPLQCSSLENPRDGGA